MELHVGDHVELKKPHPCGGKNFTLLRVGMDCRLRCETCDSFIRLARRDLERRIKKVSPILLNVPEQNFDTTPTDL